MSILKCTVPPCGTLISVAKPWMLESPIPETSHWFCGVPGRQFSASISLPGAAHEAWALGATAARPASATAAAAAAMASRSRFRREPGLDS